ncbi:hypothetical protein TEA_024522 [Camellia sinensis var. sinensis]|uniref:Malic enzyme N-terminal domain-containing protein n=1 Tax=Camellia sinensis var. sinensis TaxID=542762 RepID=A0A4S4DEY5_CAMSN|nr:hypothetical protein TEA_024522 [Camellia sinensis var. sinensis]
MMSSSFVLDLGLQEHRLDGEEYISVIDEFMEAVFSRWPNVIVQFEDFQSKWAFKLLQRYRNSYRMFNDDVQDETLKNSQILRNLQEQGMTEEGSKNCIEQQEDSNFGITPSKGKGSASSTKPTLGIEMTSC